MPKVKDSQVNPSEDNPWVEAGMTAYKQNFARQKLLSQVAKDAFVKGEPNLAAQIGVFVVYVQELELILKRTINITYGFKSFFNNKGYSILYDTDGITSDKDSLGKLVNILRLIRIRDEKTHKAVLEDFIVKLNSFVSKRNNYIHKLLTDSSIDDLDKLKSAVVEANLELISLLDDADAITKVLDTIFELDGLPYTFARHMISSEKYKEKS